jgi:hypothetical protein
MHLVITEKQLKKLSSQLIAFQDVKEEDDPAAAAPEAGTSSDGANKTGATKWESGATRGPGNQIGVTKWSDVVGSTLKRGKANPLSEQVLLGGPVPIDPVALNNTFNPATDTPTKEYITFWGDKINLPADGSVTVSLWKDDPEKPRALHFKNAVRDPDMPEYIYWPQNYVNPETKKLETKNELAPDDDWLRKKFPTGTVKYIETNSDKRIYTVLLTQRSKKTGWEVNNNYFYTDTGAGKHIPFDPKKYVHVSFTTDALKFLKENWPIIGEIVVSIAAGILTGGSSLLVQALVQSGVALTFAGSVYALSDKKSADTVGLVTGILIGCLPFIPAATKLGLKGPLKGLAKYGDELALAKNEDEILGIIAKFDEAEQILITRCMKQIPKAEFEKVLSNKLIQGFADQVKSGKIVLSKIPGSQLRWWKELLVEGGGAIPIAVGGHAYSSIQERKDAEKQILDLIKLKSADTTQPANNSQPTNNTQSANTTKPVNGDPLSIRKNK